MISIEKPGSPSEILHYGKKGMKWGVRTAPKTSAGRTQAIQRARAGQIGTRTHYATEARGSAARAKAKKVHLNNPDRATALRLSRGEKVTLGIIAGVLAVPSAGIVPAAIGVGVGANVLQRRHIEKKQARGGYG
jgi:hypothetical protein